MGINLTPPTGIGHSPKTKENPNHTTQQGPEAGPLCQPGTGSSIGLGWGGRRATSPGPPSTALAPLPRSPGAQCPCWHPRACVGSRRALSLPLPSCFKCCSHWWVQGQPPKATQNLQQQGSCCSTLLPPGHHWQLPGALLTLHLFALPATQCRAGTPEGTRGTPAPRGTKGRAGSCWRSRSRPGGSFGSPCRSLWFAAVSACPGPELPKGLLEVEELLWFGLCLLSLLAGYTILIPL